jgi:hypothetical protein
MLCMVVDLVSRVRGTFEYQPSREGAVHVRSGALAAASQVGASGVGSWEFTSPGLCRSSSRRRNST